MMHHLATIAFEAGFKELITEVLPDNAAMLKVFEKSGFPSVCSASRGSCMLPFGYARAQSAGLGPSAVIPGRAKGASPE
jgi:hypothetical protein